MQPTMLSVLGVDIGGANLKAAHSSGTAKLQPFSLWKRPQDLAEVLRALLCQMPAFDQLAVTMTGELCDCFATRREGVLAILDAAELAAAGRPIRIWCCQEEHNQEAGAVAMHAGSFAAPKQVRHAPLTAAAGNWLALATFVARFVEQDPGLLVDIGSTTSDIIPLAAGSPAPRGHNDRERLRWGELVYTGVRRTPVCALLQGRTAAELFATTLDVYLLLENLPEDQGTDTADGRSATREHAHARMARMLCDDGDTCPHEETLRLAHRAARVQEGLLRRALGQVIGLLGMPPQTLILAGTGEFLARRVLVERMGLAPAIVSLADRLGPALSDNACAYAVAVLAAEGNHD
jgi:probable H4MPT-linked C1 transfer pathway protein